MRIPKDPPIIDKEFLRELKLIVHRCEWSGCHKRTGLHAHHIHGRGFGGGKRKDTPEEVIILCSDHHAHCHARGLSREVQEVCYERITHRTEYEKRQIRLFYESRSA